jgi:hypothetical protein
MSHYGLAMYHLMTHACFHTICVDEDSHRYSTDMLAIKASARAIGHEWTDGIYTQIRGD